MNVKLGICNFCVPGTGVFAPQLVAEAGLDGMSIEFGTYEKGFPLSSKRIQDAYLEAAKQYQIEYCNIGCSCFDFIPFCVHRGHRLYKDVQTALKLAVDAAEYMDIPLVFIPAFGVSAIDSEEKFENAVKMFQFVCAYAKEKGISIGSENMMSAKKEIELVERVAADNFGIFYDSDNLFYQKGYDQVEMLEKLYPYMVPQLHVKDGKAGVLAGDYLGEGDSDFYSVINFLKERNFSGWIISENLYEEKDFNSLDVDVYDIYRKDIEILKKAVM